MAQELHLTWHICSLVLMLWVRPERLLQHQVMVWLVVSQTELAFSCLYTTALDRLLCKGPRTLACLHQVSSRVRNGSNLSTLKGADVSVFSLVNIQPTYPILLADLKNTDLPTVVRKSVLYGINAVSLQVGTLHWSSNLAFHQPAKNLSSTYTLLLMARCGMFQL